MSLLCELECVGGCGRGGARVVVMFGGDYSAIGGEALWEPWVSPRNSPVQMHERQERR